MKRESNSRRTNAGPVFEAGCSTSYSIIYWRSVWESNPVGLCRPYGLAIRCITILPTLHYIGALGETRTHTLRSLKPLTLPIGLQGRYMVGSERLELSRLSALASKTSVATITPRAHILIYQELSALLELFREK